MKRIGVLVPLGNVAHAREFEALRPDGVEFRFAEFPYPSLGPGFRADLIEAVRGPLLSLGAVDKIVFGCATASVICPDAGESMEVIAGVPVVMSAQASVEALKRLGARSVAVASPYGPATNQAIAAFLADRGIGTVSAAGMNLDLAGIANAWKIPEDEVLALGRAADSAEAEAIYFPCTALGSLGVLSRLGKPAVSSILASFEALNL